MSDTQTKEARRFKRIILLSNKDSQPFSMGDDVFLVAEEDDLAAAEELVSRLQVESISKSRRRRRLVLGDLSVARARVVQAAKRWHKKSSNPAHRMQLHIEVNKLNALEAGEPKEGEDGE